jgi:predicted ester cyclase
LEEIADRWMSFWQGAPLDDFESVHSPDFVDHSAGDRTPDRIGLRQGIVDLYRAFPDFAAATTVLAIDHAEGLVTIRWTAEGHHDGEFMGIAATGGRIGFAGIELIRIRDGQVVERWGEWDEGGIRRQLARPQPVP